MGHFHKAKPAALVYMALVINRRRNEIIKYQITLREETGKGSIGLMLNTLHVLHLNV
jgi:hypothetical protein